MSQSVLAAIKGGIYPILELEDEVCHFTPLAELLMHCRSNLSHLAAETDKMAILLSGNTRQSYR